MQHTLTFTISNRFKEAGKMWWLCWLQGVRWLWNLHKLPRQTKIWWSWQKKAVLCEEKMYALCYDDLMELYLTPLCYLWHRYTTEKSQVQCTPTNHSEHIHTAEDIHLQANERSNVCSKTYQWPASCSTWSTHASCTSFSTTTDVSNRSMACRFYNVPELTDVLYVYSLSWSVYFVHVYIWALSTLCLWQLIV